MTEHMSPILPNPERELSYGEKAVELASNPTNDPAVYAIKSTFAHLIDQMHNIGAEGTWGQQMRSAGVAIEHMQTAAMWAVKALTVKG